MEAVATRNAEQATGKTLGGNYRDVTAERIGKVTIYKRAHVFYLYYREYGLRIRRRASRNLAVARAATGASTIIGTFVTPRTEILFFRLYFSQ